MEVVCNPSFEPNRHDKMNLHTKALDWYTDAFSVDSLSHISQNKPATPPKQTNRHQLTSNNNTNILPTVHMAAHATIYNS